MASGPMPPAVLSPAVQGQAGPPSPAATQAFSPTAGVAFAQALPAPVDLTEQDEEGTAAARNQSRSSRALHM